MTHALQALWHRAVDSGRIVGGVLLLAEAGKIRYASARGWADREAGRCMQRDTPLRLASLSKLLSSVTVLRLAELGQLDLDGAVSDWLDYFTPRLADGSPARISLRQLLCHTAGLGYGFELPPGHAYWRAGVSDGLDSATLSLEQNLRRLAELPLLFAPGSAWRYSLATDVLGAMIEAASGLPLAAAIQLHVTGPLQMQATGFAGDQHLARAYKDTSGLPVLIGEDDTLQLDGGVARLSARRIWQADAYASAGAGLVGTADDYLRLLECLRQGGAPLLSPASTALLLGNALGDLPMASRGPGWGFGLGPAILTDPRRAGQPQGPGTWGWCGLYGCHYWVDPQAQRSLVVLTNTAVAGAWGALADGLVAALY
ncbi:serine hydrolase domain-containing protein [Pseudomonas sp. DTU_2021_1001937_2_SI_NGA_ILE_001]|uniref:serine hydrolase domain-containing protein n=1 Tax=Pseudomonas sp. DTU_2021_1001937_2_SI_NGA_ILE_001 TaxID=3077589 RepID=UPI0028FC2FFA|nr:serine hydrolase domain-containing protein [Pseudomonas sp. DTU_2021_1001937_2_SI_NGA_ILE_001]WNW10163.1 serine hydrolase domain-containing protein [Pseudomonas sp. DTU_2021_1001937_2_SI_NGA_ILE_001]